jgi:2-polyprenyl-6-methoxyphenol hydroxylase-like FAD-dependent oxidoreductase
VTDVLIAGAGLGGLAAALFSARRGHRVTVLERDPRPPPGATVEQDFENQHRRGVAHSDQGHAFLGLSTRVLRQEAPDVIAAIVARGAMQVPIGPGSTDSNLLCRRRVYESVLRRVVENEPGVTIESEVGVIGLSVHGEAGGAPRVTGLRTADGAVVPGTIVVDATGRRSQVERWLRDIGARPPVQTAQPCGFSYLTRHFRLREAMSFPRATVPIVAELDYATALVFPGDNGCFQLSTTVGAHDPLRHRLRDPQTFGRFLASVPALRPWLERGEPTGDPLPMARLENRLRRLVDAAGPVVTGLVLLADAAMQTNPTFGRGVSLAFLHAQGLADQLDDAASADPAGWAVRFDDWGTRHLVPWFEIQLATDTARMAQLQSVQRGEPHRAPTDAVSRFLAAMAILREDDAEIRQAADRVYNLLMTPRELMSDRTLARRILAFVRANPQASVPHDGPDRAQFERMVASR